MEIKSCLGAITSSGILPLKEALDGIFHIIKTLRTTGHNTTFIRVNVRFAIRNFGAHQE